jgi:hypothetical protein
LDFGFGFGLELPEVDPARDPPGDHSPRHLNVKESVLSAAALARDCELSAFRFPSGYLRDKVLQVVFQRSIPANIRQLIRAIVKNKITDLCESRILCKTTCKTISLRLTTRNWKGAYFRCWMVQFALQLVTRSRISLGACPKAQKQGTLVDKEVL